MMRPFLSKPVASTLALCAMIGASPAFAQNMSAGATWQRWTLGTPIGDSLRLVSAQQMVMPLAFSFNAGQRWTVNATGAWTKGQTTFLNAADTEVTRDLSGPTDIRIRATGSFRGDALSLAVGVNAPTGRTSLDPDELQALRILASPAAGMPAPVLGSGFGATIGLIAARTVGRWAFAAGATYEQRGSYAATEQLAAGRITPTRVKPGPGAHVSLGATGAVGNGEMSLYAAADLFGTDALEVDVSPTPVETHYRLGPMFNLNWTYSPGITRLPDLQTFVGVRLRTAFEDDVRGKVDGSSGAMVSGGAGATVWRAGSWRLRTAVDARMYSGLDVDSSFVTARFHDVGVTATLSIPAGRSSIEPFVRVSTGSVNLGAVSSGSQTLAFGGRLVVR